MCLGDERGLLGLLRPRLSCSTFSNAVLPQTPSHRKIRQSTSTEYYLDVVRKDTCHRLKGRRDCEAFGHDISAGGRPKKQKNVNSTFRHAKTKEYTTSFDLYQS